jgi:hypothetical protein
MPCSLPSLFTITIPTSSHLMTKERINIKSNKINVLIAIRREHLKAVVCGSRKVIWGKYTQAGIEDINFHVRKKEGERRSMA